MKRVLMVAFHFPPATGSSGIQRTLRFVQHLPSLGWEPVVVTAHARAHERTSPDLLRDVPPGVKVVPAFALDTARHLALGGRYPGFLARPDRWQSWRYGGVAAGLSLMKRHRCDVIWSTYPIATAHVIGASLHRRTGVPWVADFRDPMAQDGYPADPVTWRMFKAIEQGAVRDATRSVFTTPGAAQVYRERYPSVPKERFAVIENGYDEESFAGSDARAPAAPNGKLTLVHSGVVYPSERDPTQLIQALALLKTEGVLRADSFCLRFRASEHDALIDELAKTHGVRDLVELERAVPYRDALAEMMRADGLVVMQATNCNAQIPAKIYEYLRAGRPVLGLTDPVGDTAQVLRRAGVSSIAPLDSAPAIAELLRRFVRRDDGTAWTAGADAVRQVSRQARALELARLLDEVSAGR
ncbi:MAG TPA: glycosyltransferase [Albitalea sp.]|uniref:glycosyltransferase n=1 Tax=Piscinibacter sp. TaxID=1903157 RepID=UPI002ED4782F